MKTQLKLIILLVTSLFLGCYQKPKNKEVEKNDTTETIKTDSTESIVKTDNNVIKIEQLKQLIPIDTVNSKSKNVYEKFGLEFQGNCYDCDLAALSIAEKTIKLTNVCDEKQNQVLEVLEIKNTNNEVIIKTKQFNFIFSEIDKVPIYELKITGNTINFEGLRISRYYTLKKLLKKFKEHDCGDFEG